MRRANRGFNWHNRSLIWLLIGPRQTHLRQQPTHWTRSRRVGRDGWWIGRWTEVGIGELLGNRMLNAAVSANHCCFVAVVYFSRIGKFKSWSVGVAMMLRRRYGSRTGRRIWNLKVGRQGASLKRQRGQLQFGGHLREQQSINRHKKMLRSWGQYVDAQGMQEGGDVGEARGFEGFVRMTFWKRLKFLAIGRTGRQA